MEKDVEKGVKTVQLIFIFKNKNQENIFLFL